MRLFFALLASLALTASLDITHTDLGGEAGGQVQAHAVTDDGVVVGYASASSTRAVIWENGVRRDLPVPSVSNYSIAWDVTADGRAVGRANGARPDGLCCYTHAAIWTASGVELLPMPGTYAEARGVNDAGTIVAGRAAVPAQGSGSSPVTWDVATGALTIMETLTGHGFLFDVDDQGVAVGYVRHPDLQWRPAVWAPDGSLLTPEPPLGARYGYLYAIRDGVAVGLAQIGGRNHMIRWSAENGWENLGIPEGATGAIAWGISAEAGRIAGSAVYNDGAGSYWQPIVIEGGEVHRLPHDGSFGLSTGVSPDGTTVSGNTYHGRYRGALWTVAPSNPAPVIAAFPDVAGYEWEEVTFTASASDPEGEALTYAWDFGDGSTSDAEGPTHVYTQEGEYTVTLTVTDEAGRTATATATAHISNTAPVLTVTGGDAVTEQPFTLEASFTDGLFDAPWVWRVDWDGDGPGAAESTGSLEELVDGAGSFTATHTFTEPGDINVTVTVTDNTLGSTTETVVIHVEPANHPPVADAGGPYQVDEGTPLLFDGSGSSDPDPDDVLTFAWTFGSYGTGTGPTPTFTFLDDAVVPVALTLTDAGGLEASAQTSVTVRNVAPSVTAGGDATILEGSTFTRPAGFVDPGADEWTATVDYGTGAGPEGATRSGTALELSHTYVDDGVHPIVVAVADDDGGQGEASFTLTVENVAPSVTAGGAATLDEGQTFTRAGSFTDPGADTWSATVDYGDGAAALDLDGTSFALSRSFLDDMDGSIQVAVTDDDGGVGTATIPLVVRNVAPVVTMPADASLVEGDTWAGSGSFADPGADTWTATVDYGDGPGSLTLAGLGFELERTFVDDGAVDVGVTVADDDGGVGRGTARIHVANAPPVVDAGSDAEIFSGEPLPSGASFTDAGAVDGPWSWTLDWSTGTAAGSADAQGALATPTPLVTASGTYTVRLRVTDKDGGSGEDTYRLVVRRVPVTVDVNPGSINLKSKGNGRGGTLSAAVLSTASFDATTLDLATVVLGDGEGADVGIALKNNGTFHAATEDVDGDGRLDLVVHVRREALEDAGELHPGTTALTLRGTTASGVEVTGTDAVRVIS